jgi:hypothetical protein
MKSETRLNRITAQITSSPKLESKNEAVIVCGVRTPFVRSFGKLMHVKKLSICVF